MKRLNYQSIDQSSARQGTEMNYDPLTFWESRAKDWLKTPKPMGGWAERLKPYIDFESWRTLELGCGSGRWSPYFNFYTGADISPTLLEYCVKRYPDNTWAHHDMRQSITGDYDLIFTFTAWEHVPPEDIKKVKLPKTARLAFVEPHNDGTNGYCFTHNYEKLFGAKPIIKHKSLTLYGRGLL